MRPVASIRICQSDEQESRVIVIRPYTKQISGTPVEKVAGDCVLSTAISVTSEKAFVVTWVAYCVWKKQKAFCVAFSKH